MRGDYTLFTSAEGIESLWRISEPLLSSPPPVIPYKQGSWGPEQMNRRMRHITGACSSRDPGANHRPCRSDTGLVARHEAVERNKMYARKSEAGTVHTNAADGYFSIFKRGLVGTYQYVGEQHLPR